MKPRASPIIILQTIKDLWRMKIQKDSVIQWAKNSKKQVQAYSRARVASITLRVCWEAPMEI